MSEDGRRPDPLSLTFNDLLRLEDVDPKDVRLVRHQIANLSGNRTLYDLWKSHPQALEEYQRVQRGKEFVVGNIVASFVVTPAPHQRTLFIGLYSVRGVALAAPGSTDAVTGEPTSGWQLYDLVPDDRLRGYAGKLVIDWGKGHLAWKQLASKQNKSVLEIRTEPDPPPFPGFERFRCLIHELSSIPDGWKDRLASVKGVYLLIEQTSGRQYVGSATGDKSLWGRWQDYAANGHGGDKELKALHDPRYQVAVLQAVPMVTLDEPIPGSHGSEARKGGRGHRVLGGRAGPGAGGAGHGDVVRHPHRAF